jgi:hypothetical protein
VQASLRTGNDLYRDCTQGNEREPFCLGYIVSVVAVNRALGGRICLSGNVTIGQLRQVVTTYLAESITPSEARRCAVCGEAAWHGFGPPGFPLQLAEAWYCSTHGDDGAGLAARYRGSSLGPAVLL